MQPDGYVLNQEDCDDTDPSIYPRPVRVIGGQGYPGQTQVSVFVMIDDAIGVAGGDIYLKYDKNILTAQDIIIGPLIQGFLTDSYIIKNEGKIVLGMANISGIESESGTLAEIIFDVSEDAVVGDVVPLVFEMLSLYDEYTESYCVLPINGEFRITESGFKGDLNQDERITSVDTILTQQITVGVITEPSDYQIWAGDVNEDGEINSADAILILRAAVTKETIFVLHPDHGLPCGTVKIIGWNFGESQDGSGVYFGDVSVGPISWMNHEIVTAVPLNIQAGSVDVSVMNAYGFASNTHAFIVDQKNQGLGRFKSPYRTEEASKTVDIPTGIMAEPGDQVSIPVETNDASDLAGMDLELSFDPAILTPVQVERTDLTDDFLLMFKDFGNGRLVVSLVNDTAIIEGSGALIKVIFDVSPNAQGSDSNGVNIRNVQFYDENAEPVEVMASQEGQVLIGGEDSYESAPPSKKPSYSTLIWPSSYFLNAYQPESWTVNWTYPIGTGYGPYYPYHSSQQVLNPVSYWIQNRYDYYQTTMNYQAIYPDISFFISW
jgi:hypothetical protein